jgi:hypothetical protein
MPLDCSLVGVCGFYGWTRLVPGHAFAGTPITVAVAISKIIIRIMTFPPLRQAPGHLTRDQAPLCFLFKL